MIFQPLGIGDMVEVFVVGAIIFIAFVFSVEGLPKWESKRKREQRQRQKLLDRQNNVGRQLRNFLEKLASDLDLTHLSANVVEGNGYEVLTQVSVIMQNHPDFDLREVLVVRIWVDLFDHEQARWKTPIRVYLQGQYAHEQWPSDDIAIEALKGRLHDYLYKTALHYKW